MTNTTNNDEMKIVVFDFIDKFHKAIISQNHKNIESVLGPLIKDESNKYWTDYKFNSFEIGKGILISSGRVVKDGNRLEIRGNVEISGTCITKEDLFDRFGKLPVTGIPSGVAGSSTTFSATFEESKMGFGFEERNPDCLASFGAIILNPPEYPFGKPT